MNNQHLNDSLSICTVARVMGVTWENEDSIGHGGKEYIIRFKKYFTIDRQ